MIQLTTFYPDLNHYLHVQSHNGKESFRILTKNYNTIRKSRTSSHQCKGRKSDNGIPPKKSQMGQRRTSRTFTSQENYRYTLHLYVKVLQIFFPFSRLLIQLIHTYICELSITIFICKYYQTVKWVNHRTTIFIYTCICIRSL